MKLQLHQKRTDLPGRKPISFWQLSSFNHTYSSSSPHRSTTIPLVTSHATTASHTTSHGSHEVSIEKHKIYILERTIMNIWCRTFTYQPYYQLNLSIKIHTPNRESCHLQHPHQIQILHCFPFLLCFQCCACCRFHFRILCHQTASQMGMGHPAEWTTYVPRMTFRWTTSDYCSCCVAK